MRSRAFSSKKLPIAKNNKKKLSSQRKPSYGPAMNNNQKDNNNFNYGVINPASNPMKENILNDLENNNVGNGNYSIDYIRGKKNNFHSNVNLSGCFPIKIKNEGNNIEEINKNDKMDKIMNRTKSAKKIFSINNNNLNNINNFNSNNNVIKVEKNIFFENVKKILLYPYFLPRYMKNINNLTIKNIEDAIGVYLLKKNFKYQCQDKDHVFIISKRHGYKFDNIKQKRIYVLPKNKADNFGLNMNNNNEDKNINLRNEKILDNIYTKDESIDNIDLNAINNNSNTISNLNKSNNNTEIHNSINSVTVTKNPDETKLIKDCFILCYTNKNRISKEQLSQLDKIFLDEDNKLFFANLILPDPKIKKTKNHKQLTPTSFEDLLKMLSLSLNHINSNEYNTCRLLTISIFVYYKIDNKKLIYLYQNIISGIYPCRLWLTEDFWKNFFKFEFEEEKKNESDLINLYKYNFNGSINYMLDIEKNIIEKNKDQILLDTTMFMAEIMIKLKLSKNFILKVFKNNILEQYIEDKNKIEVLINQILELFDKF
jgi:hypothetical protein